jgi:hypothetical protein
MTELQKLIERAKKEYSSKGIDWKILEMPNKGLIIVPSQGNTHIGTYNFRRVCDSSNS